MVRLLFILLFSVSICYGQANRFVGFGTKVSCSDADGQKFIDSSGITNQTEKDAICTLVKQLKDSSLWTKIDAVYPYVGSSSSSCKWNLKDPRNLDAAFRLTFSGGWTFSSTGALPNGTNAYANTYWNSVSDAGTANASFGVFLRTNTADAIKYDIGAVRSTPSAVSIILPRFGNTLYCSINSVGFYTAATNTDTRGFYCASIIYSSNILAQKNSTIYTVTATNVSDNNLPIFIGARNSDGSPQYYSDREHIIGFLGNGLTSAEMLTLYNIFSNFKTATGR